jgi:hypothetical protein
MMKHKLHAREQIEGKNQISTACLTWSLIYSRAEPVPELQVDLF